MAIQLIALDIDGTLLNSKNELTSPTLDALQRAADRGIHIVLGTGRMVSECRELLARLPMIHYAVTCTGTQVVDVKTGETLFRRSLTAEELRRLCTRVADLDVMLQIFDDRDGLIHNDAAMLAHAERFCRPELARAMQLCHGAEPDFAAYLRDFEGPTNKLHMFFANPADKAEAIRRLSGTPYYMSESHKLDLELMPPGVDKGVGVMALAELLGLDRSQVMAIGDGGNDVGMLRCAGLAVAMGNGSAEAKAAAHRIAPDNDHDGAAATILQMLEETT